MYWHTELPSTRWGRKWQTASFLYPLKKPLNWRLPWFTVVEDPTRLLVVDQTYIILIIIIGMTYDCDVIAIKKVNLIKLRNSAKLKRFDAHGQPTHSYMHFSGTVEVICMSPPWYTCIKLYMLITITSVYSFCYKDYTKLISIIVIAAWCCLYKPGIVVNFLSRFSEDKKQTRLKAQDQLHLLTLHPLYNKLHKTPIMVPFLTLP